MHAVSQPESSLRSRLLDDHHDLEALMARILEACERDDREGISEAWGELDARVMGHLETEDRYLVPALMRTNEREARAIMSEHRHIRTRLVELGAAVDLHTIRAETARSFIDDLRAHASHEDEMLYRIAEDTIPYEEHEGIFEAMAHAVRERLERRKAHKHTK
jgi:hemerythrin-like domain-containing protein